MKKIKQGYIRSIYYVHELFRGEINPPAKVIGIVILAVYAWIKYRQGDNKATKEALFTICVFVGYGLVAFFCQAMINLFIKQAGGNFSPYIDCYFDTAKKIILIKPISSSSSDFTCATEGDLDDIVLINGKAYSNTIWHTSDKIKRNQIKSHLKINDGKYIMLIKSEVKGKSSKKIVGYTHIIPVNINDWFKFKTNGIKATEFLDEAIVPHDASSRKKDQQPFGLIIFTSCVGKKIETTPQENRKEKSGKLLANALASHIAVFLKREFSEHKIIPAIFQTLDYGLRKKIKKHTTNPKEFSKDYARIICIEFSNENMQEKKIADKQAVVNAGGVKAPEEKPVVERKNKPVVKAFEWVIIGTIAFLMLITYLCVRLSQ